MAALVGSSHPAPSPTEMVATWRAIAPFACFRHIGTAAGNVSLILDILPDADPILHSRLSDFSFNSGVDVESLIADMFETMTANNGIGLAANQCGLPHRVFVMDTQGVRMAAFNPTIEDVSPDNILMQEGCLTFPDLHLKIKRREKIRLHYYDDKGEKCSMNLAGWPARVSLHEIDHLNGVVMTDLVSKLKLQMARKKSNL